MEFTHVTLEAELQLVTEEALGYVHGLNIDDVIKCDPTCVSEIIKQYLVVTPELGEFYIEKDIFEMSEAFSNRKTGKSGLFVYISYTGEKRWVNQVRYQEFDGYPLAFAEEDRIRVVIVFDPDSEDADDLKDIIVRKKDLVQEYVDSVEVLLRAFNERLTNQII